jgi:prepilin-type processing-associated H-X9-DG protein
VIHYGAILGSSWAPGDVDAETGTNAIEYGALFPYNKSPGIYRCPADRSGVPSANGQGTVPRARGYKMSLWLNCISEPFGYQRESEIANCGKAFSDIFVFIDMHREGYHDPAFGIYQQDDSWRGDMWIDLPADRHNRGANLGFLDGHVEHHRWKAPKVVVPPLPMDTNEGPDRDDLRWLQARIPPRASQSWR